MKGRGATDGLPNASAALRRTSRGICAESGGESRPVSSSQSGCDLQLSLVGAGGIEPPTSAL